MMLPKLNALPGRLIVSLRLQVAKLGSEYVEEETIDE